MSCIKTDSGSNGASEAPFESLAVPAESAAVLNRSTPKDDARANRGLPKNRGGRLGLVSGTADNFIPNLACVGRSQVPHNTLSFANCEFVQERRITNTTRRI